MRPNDFRVGQTAYYFHGYKYVDGVRQEKPLIPVTVVSVGRKYVTTDCGFKFEAGVSSKRHLTEHGYRYGRLYRSKHDREIEQEENALRGHIWEAMRCGNLKSCTLGQLRMIQRFLVGEGGETHDG